MKPRRAGLALALVSLCAGSPDAQQPSDGVHGNGLELRPTAHAPLPSALREYWLVPTASGGVDPKAQAYQNFRRVIDLVKGGQAAEASILIDPAALAGTPLAAYAHYVKGQAQMALGRFEEARTSFAAAAATKPDGWLRVAVPIGAAQASESLADSASAARFYAEAAADFPEQPDLVLASLARARAASGETERAWDAYRRLVFDHPGSEFAVAGRAGLEQLAPLLGRSAYGSLTEEWTRAEKLYAARKYGDARVAFEYVNGLASEAQREPIALRLAAIHVRLGRPQAVLDLVQPYLSSGSRQAEAQHYRLQALRRLKRVGEYTQGVRRLVDEHPTSAWAEAALNDLGTHYVLVDEDAKALDVFREMVERFPTGENGDRAAWRYGWGLYRSGALEDAAAVFDGAAARFPRSDYRPSYVYWAGRAHDGAGRRDVAQARYQLAVLDYGHSYYGRLSRQRLEAGGSQIAPVAPAGETPRGDLSASVATDGLIRQLLALELFDEAFRELAYAKRAWGDSPALQATTAWTVARQGDLRRGITLMKRAYPQYLTAQGAALPIDVQRVLFPLQYWDTIRRHAKEHALDPFLLAALIAQESTFSPTIKSSANAVGLMQILPRTGRQLARSRGMKSFVPAHLTRPEVNVELGTTLVARLRERFGDMHLVLASYNAGDSRVRRWLAQKPALPADEFIDDIPFPETQNYVKKILGTADDYRRLYGELGALPLASETAMSAPGAPALTGSGTKAAASSASAASRKGTTAAAKPASQKATSKTVTPKKAAPRKAAPRKAAPRKAAPAKAAPRTPVPAKKPVPATEGRAQSKR